MIPCSHWWPQKMQRCKNGKQIKGNEGVPGYQFPARNNLLNWFPVEFLWDTLHLIPVLWLTWNRSAVCGPGTRAWGSWWGVIYHDKRQSPKRRHTNEAESWGTEVRWQMISEDSGKTGTIWAAENNDYYHKTKFSYFPSPLWRACLHGIGLVKLLKFPLI